MQTRDPTKSDVKPTGLFPIHDSFDHDEIHFAYSPAALYIFQTSFRSPQTGREVSRQTFPRVVHIDRMRSRSLKNSKSLRNIRDR